VWSEIFTARVYFADILNVKDFRYKYAHQAFTSGQGYYEFYFTEKQLEQMKGDTRVICHNIRVYSDVLSFVRKRIPLGMDELLLKIHIKELSETL